MPPILSQFVLTFLESVGRRQDAEVYLRLFQELPKQSFAVIAPTGKVMAQAPELLLEPLRFLAELQLYPVVVLGLWPPAEAATPTRALRTALERARVPCCELTAPPAEPRAGGANSQPLPSAQQVADCLISGRATLFDLSALSEEARFTQLAEMLRALNSRKLVLVRTRGGLGPHQAGALSLTPSHQLLTDEHGVNVLNLTTDLSRVCEQQQLSVDEIELLKRVQTLHQAHPSLITNITSPPNLLRELFTVKGAGTLVKTGSEVSHRTTFHDLNIARLVALLEGTFGRKLKRHFLSIDPIGIYLEVAYRAVAIVHPGVHGAFLSKFAVNRLAQGEGIGRDIWERLVRDHPIVYWRAQCDNPIAAWYQNQCDGCQRVGQWRVYWRGVATHHIQDVVRDALMRPIDFEETQHQD